MATKKYLILTAHQTTHLAEQVNEYIEKGYLPVGGVCHVKGYTSVNDKFMQAMIQTH